MLAVIKSSVLSSRCASNAGLFLIFVSQLSALSCHTSNFGVGILVMQQSFLRMETICTVGNIIQFLKTKINLEKYENPIFSIRLASALDLSSLYEWFLLSTRLT